MVGTGKKKIEIKKITKENSRMVTFSKRRKGLFNKAKEVESMTGSRVASVVFSPTGRLSTYGDVESAIQRHFPSTSDAVVVVSDGSSRSRSSSTPRKNGLRKWVEGIDVKGCQNLNQLLMLKKQLEGTRDKILSNEDAESFEALFA
ncbi:MADS-box transcription factor 23-like [Solanum dulcamara]|uniref:MADS-box transcription factor 23-like n=1 Tax=Solanum dulcamara TaxID=45834 RepID=UPI0024861E1B|nr:MADS-box transcription factor 23-like [Solanum dulcamara]